MFAYFWGAVLIALPLFMRPVQITYSICKPTTSTMSKPTYRCSNKEVTSLGNEYTERVVKQTYLDHGVPILIETSDSNGVKTLVHTNQIKSIADGKNFFFLFCVLMSIVCFGFRKKLKDTDKKLLALMGVLCSMAFFNTHSFASTLYQYQATFFLIGCVLLSQLICNLDDFGENILVKFMGAACLIQSALVIIGYLNLEIYDNIVSYIVGIKPDIISANMGTRVYGRGSLNNPHYTGMFIALTLPSLYKKWPLLIIGMIGLLLTQSSTATIAFFAGAVVVLYIKYFKRKHFWKFFALCSTSFLAVLSMSFITGGYFSNSTRYLFWGNILKMVHGPGYFWGHGLGYIGDRYNELFAYRLVVDRAHNEYMEIYVAFGIIGLASIIAYLYSKKEKIFSGNTTFLWTLVTAMAGSVGSFPFHLSPTALVSLISFGALLRPRSEL